MNSCERVLEVLNLEEPDRVPIGSFAAGIGGRVAGFNPIEYCTSGKRMAQGQRILHEKYGFDILFPFSHVGMIAEGWGCRIKYLERDVAPMIDDYIVKKAADWEKLEILNPARDGKIPVILDAVGRLKDRLKDDAFVLGVMFSPITTATHVRVMMDVLRDVMKEPGLLKEGLDVITESLIAEAEALEEVGADAIFLAITRATAEVMTKKQYEDIAIEFDKRLLRSIDIPVIVHACGKEPYMDLILSLPHISGINWWDRGSIFTLKDMKERYGRIVALFGGLDQTRTFVRGATREDVINEGRDAIATAGHDGGFVLFSGCDLPIQVPAELLGAIKACVDLYGNYPLEV